MIMKYLIIVLSIIMLSPVYCFANIILTDHEKKLAKKYYQKYKQDKQLINRIKNNKHNIKFIREQFQKNNLPLNLIYITIVESDFNHKCKYKNTHGLWQLDTYTSKFYGMKSKSDLYNIHKSTLIVCKYLKFLQNKFKNNHRHMIYAYNCGDIKVVKLIKNNKLPKITRRYIPKLFGAKKLVEEILN